MTTIKFGIICTNTKDVLTELSLRAVTRNTCYG